MNHIPSGQDKVRKTARVTLEILKKNLFNSARYTFLDIGCGDGRDIAYLSSNLENLTMRGIDISKEAIDNATELNSCNENVAFTRMDWKDLDDTPYDIIYTSGVYHFFPLLERRAFISKVKTILNPNGFFILNTLSANDTQYYGEGESVKGDPNSFQGEYFIHFCSERELRKDFGFLTILDLSEYFHKNYSHDRDYHTMWILVGNNK